MFTGIVEATGTVRAADARGDVMSVRIEVEKAFGTLAKGASISVNGCCLTAVKADKSGFHCELTEETLRRTAFHARLRPGARVNLERPVRVAGRLDGHLVQGHVDGVGRVRLLRRTGDAAELAV